MSNNNSHKRNQPVQNMRLEDIIRNLNLKNGANQKPIRAPQNRSRLIIKGRLLFSTLEQIDGATIRFVMDRYDKNYLEALDYILGKRAPEVINTQNGEILLPLINKNNVLAKRYLRFNRMIDSKVIDAFIRKRMIYQSNSKVNKKVVANIVFLGYDKEGKIQHIHKRAANVDSKYRVNVKKSVPEYSFHWNGTDDSIYFFEAPIDMLSYISMNEEGWQQHSYAAACGMSDKVLFRCLEDNPNINKVYLCLDNDEMGESATNRIIQKLNKRKIDYEVLVPFLKDWNEDLIYELGDELVWKEFKL